VTQFYNAVLRPAGLNATQLTLLRVLSLAGETRQADLADLLAMDSTTLTRTLKLLEDESWIKISPGADRRERLFRLTQRGRDRLKLANGRWNEAQERMQDAIGRSEWTALLDALNRATRAAKKISP
jgi:DNA-binding MarR family transcriptional regulator